MSTTHIRFSSELKYVDLSNKVLSARIVEGSKDIVAVKAKEAFEFTTTMSCLEADGRLHTFIVAYDASPEVLIVDMRRSSVRPGMTDLTKTGMTDMTKPRVTNLIEPGMTDLVQWNRDEKVGVSDTLEREIYHIGDVAYDIKVLCENVIIKDDVTYIVLSIENSSAVSYSMSSPRFVIESKRKTKRGLVYEKQLFPKHTSGETVTAPGTVSRMVFSFDKVTFVKGQVFRIYLYEDGGPRNFVLSFGVRDLRKGGEK
ncbi:MAG: DUF4138 domain-containing protein [Prevotella sp.]|nr:DUF4138 domain-containing protein [Prevotella sp.]